MSEHMWIVWIDYRPGSLCEPWFSLHRTEEGARRYGEELQAEAEMEPRSDRDEQWREENGPSISIYRQQIHD